MKYILFFLLALTACNTVKKQQRKAEAFYQDHPEQLAKQCADKFPPDTIFKKGEVVVKSDTAFIKGDSIPCPPVVNEKGETVYVKVKCPDSKIIRDTITRIDTIEKINTAAVEYYRFQNDSLNKALIKVTAQKEDAKQTAANRLWWIIGFAVVIGVDVVLKIKKIV